MITLLNMTYFSFLFVSLAALGACIYFLSEVPKLEPRFKGLAYLNFIICIASGLLHIYYFSQLTVATSPSDAGPFVGTLTQFPLWGRYAFWLVTTVMLILMFPLLMGVERVGPVFVTQLVLADMAMISTGYLGEQAVGASGGLSQQAMFWFGVSSLFFAFLLWSILRAMQRIPGSDMLPVQRDALGYMFFFFLVGWSIFPAGFFYAVVFPSDVGIVLREFTVNIGDIVNKIVWGIVVVYAASDISVAMRAERNAA